MKIGQYRTYQKASKLDQLRSSLFYPDRKLLGGFIKYTPKTSTVPKAKTTVTPRWKLNAPTGRSKYMPHQGAQECARRVAQRIKLQ